MVNRLVRSRSLALVVGTVLAAGVAGAQAAPHVTSPKQQFGFDIGADYVLPNYTQFMQYWQKLATESDRMVLDTIGYTAEGRPQLMAIISSPENIKNREHYRQIAERLARAEGLTDEQAHQLAREGKGIVWFDGGLHATEVLGANQLIETVYQLVSANDPETLRFLDDLIILAVHANPDGMELVANWYMKDEDPKERSTGGIPRLYQKYVGHDNNRDFYLASQPETMNMNRVSYREWYPQVIYNHHQTGPAGTVMFAPPFRDPANYNLHPLITSGLDLVGAAMMHRFIAEDKPGVTIRRGANYSTWWDGGLRTSAYFHNMIGLLTESIGNPTPTTIPFIPSKQIRSADLPYPIKPQEWHFRQSIDYSVTANKAVFDLVSQKKEEFLYNIYEMGKDAIAKGSTDSWTIWPHDIAAITAKMEAERGQGDQSGRGGFRGRGPTGDITEYNAMRTPETRDPRGYILSAAQPEFPTAVKFANTLLKNGVDVHVATAPFSVNGKQYPAGSIVVKTAQAFRPHVLDMFEPQDHPNDFAYPGGPPIPPYDAAGWTLAMQMGVQYDRVRDGFDGPFQKFTGDTLTVPAGQVASSARNGWLLSHVGNEAFTAVNRLLKAGQPVYWVTAASGGIPQGSFYIPNEGNARRTLEQVAKERGVSFTAAPAKPATMTKLAPRRVALVDRYGGSMPSGWMRFILENFEFPFDVVYPQQLDAGNLRSKYDVIIFADGLIPASDRGGRGFGGDPTNVPEEYRGWLGSITVAKTVPQLKQFAEAGGTIITVGSSTVLGEHFGLPMSNHLVEKTASGEKELTNEQFYIPGSLLEVAVDSTLPIAHGMPDSAIVMFDNSPVYTLGANAAQQGLRPIAWFDTPTSLRSGWAWGQERLDKGVAAAVADVGKGKLYMFGPEITFRAQPHGTFKFLFNGIYAGEL
ncbi:MAG TPA: M14 metallopeptidase family protein [Gemmatimonadaceae bacterium]|nr:M14 metallopeptidase family protein [Gemmatimonadaceae bacterium]